MVSLYSLVTSKTVIAHPSDLVGKLTDYGLRLIVNSYSDLVLKVGPTLVVSL